MLRSPKGAPYSEDIWADYAPNCNSCHNRLEWKFDRERCVAKTLPGIRKAAKVFREKFDNNPDFREAFVAKAKESALLAGEVLRGKLETDPEFSEAYTEVLRENGRKVSRALGERLASDPVFAEEHRVRGAQAASVANATYRTCLKCGKRSTSGGLGVHQKRTGHEGYTEEGNP
jgi:hypothetical protein